MTQPESRLSGRIIKALNKRGACVWKVHGNEFTPAGTPDIVGAYRGYFIAVETKMPGGRLSAIQEYRIAQLRKAGGRVLAPCLSVESAVAMLGEIDGEIARALQR
jgi:Holliday junction resolvase